MSEIAQPLVQDNLRLTPREDERWPYYAPDEIAAVVEALESGLVNQWTGDSVARFETACAARLGGGSPIALTNGSVALELALRALGIGSGDEVVVSPRSFVASASCVRLVGAVPIFADVDPQSGNLSAETIAAALSPRTRAVIPVHLAGWPSEMPAIMELAQAHDIAVVEDCAQAHGAEVGGRLVGSFGDIAAYSFCQDKIITTAGEGGLLLFRSQSEWEWAWSFKDHGKSWQKSREPQTQPGFRWLHDMVGTNWRLTGPQAALGIVQLLKLDGWIEARTRNAMIWRDALIEVDGVRVPLPRLEDRHAFYRLYAYLDDRPDVELLRQEILRQAKDSGLRVFSGTCSEIYLEKAFDDLPRPDLPTTRRLGRTSLAIETHPTLDPELLRLRAWRLAEIIDNVLRDGPA